MSQQQSKKQKNFRTQKQLKKSSLTSTTWRNESTTHVDVKLPKVDEPDKNDNNLNVEDDADMKILEDQYLAMVCSSSNETMLAASNSADENVAVHH